MTKYNIEKFDFKKYDFPTPAYVCEEALLRQNLELLSDIQASCGVEILLALKGFALWDTFSLVKKYLKGCCASGLYEARLAREEFGLEVHTYSPGFKDDEFDEIVLLSDHIVFNSFAQWKKYRHKLAAKSSPGLRVNPEISLSPAELYNPCGANSRLGVTIDKFENESIQGIDGLHFHALCEQNADALELVLKEFERKFGKFFSLLKWVNFGGGHHITRADYDRQKLVSLINEFRARHPHLKVYIELGEAVGWQTGSLVASVLDIVENGKKIAILDTSSEAHMPDCVIMPYRAEVLNEICKDAKSFSYLLGANTCLAGDVMGEYSFKEPLKVGDKIVFLDMIHYTIVKNTTFNGIKLPNLMYLRENGNLEMLKEFGYDEYKRRN